MVVAITAILGSIGLSAFVSSRNARDLTANGQNTLSILRLAQGKAIAGENNSVWGVRLEQAKLTLFRGSTFAGATFTQAYPLASTVELVSLALSGGGSDVIFNRIGGHTSESGSFTLRVKQDTSNAFLVVIDASGKAYQALTAPTVLNARVIDARHRSFTLGWSIQTAVTLTLNFDNGAVIQNIPMASFFSGGALPTKFDWSGTVAVDGQDQILRIHTTMLNGSDTILSVDHDCRTNTKKLAINIDGKPIATYEANCSTTTVGGFGGTMTES